jgi:hypothetical protein
MGMHFRLLTYLIYPSLLEYCRWMLTRPLKVLVEVMGLEVVREGFSIAPLVLDAQLRADSYLSLSLSC